MMKRFNLVCIFIFCFLQTMIASDSPYFRNYLNRMGANVRTVLCIEQDLDGYIWYSTDNGLFRFDGNHSYKLNWMLKELGKDYSGYQPYFFITSSDRMILSEGDIVDLRTHIYHKKFYPIYRGGRIVEDIYKNLWIPFDGNRLCKENLNNGKSVVYIDCGVKMSDVTRRYYYFLTQNGYIKKIPLQGKAICYTLLKCPMKSSITTFCCLNDNEIMCGTDKNELYLIHIREKQIEKLMSSIYVRAIKLRNVNECWIGSEIGIYIYDIQKKTMQHILKNPLNPYALQDNVVYSIMKDKDGGMWVGHYFKGLSYCPIRICNFEVNQSQRTNVDMRGNIFREFCKDPYGNIWMGTEDGGLNCYSSSLHLYSNYSPLQPDHRIGTTNIHALAIINGNLWFGSFDNGIGVINLKTKKLIKEYKKDDGCGLMDNFVFTILSTKRYGILVGMQYGIQRFNEKTQKFEKFTLACEDGGCCHMFVDSRDRLWLCRATKIECINHNGVSIFFNMPRNCRPYRITEDSSGRIWATMDGGFARYDDVSKRFIRQKLSNGISRTYSILEDDNHFLWISSDNGLIFYNIQTGTIRIFTIDDGLPSNSFIANSCLKDADGKLYFGTFDGYLSFYPQSLNLNIGIPPLVFTRLIASSAIQSDTLYFADVKKRAIFDYRHNGISVDFAALQYASADNLDFQYQLEGLENKWHILHGYNTITYPSLSPGKYLLHLRSTDAKGRWNNNEIEYSFIIHPPFYLSKIAKLLYFVLIIAIVYILYKQTRKRIRVKHINQVELLNREKEKELFNTKINFFTTIVHEIRTPLTLIKAPLEKVLDIEEDGDKLKNLKLVEKNADRLNDLCTQLLNFRKMEASQLQLNFVVMNVGDLISEILSRFTATIESKGLKYKDNLSSVKVEAAVDKEAFTKIISNLLNNAIKYAASSIILTIKDEGSTFSLDMKNDGDLIPFAEKNNIFNMFYRAVNGRKEKGIGIGLPYCRSLAEMHKGSLSIVDNVDDMNEFLLVLPKHQKMEFKEVLLSDNDTSDIIENGIQGESTAVKKNILLVEDEKGMRQFIKNSIPPRYKVIEASNGEQALEVLEKTSIDLVVTDVMMPKMDGCELCREICNRMEWSNIPVIMLTAKVDVEARLEGYASGAEDYIEKPFSMKYLVARMDIVLRKVAKRNSMFQSKDNDTLLKTIESRSDRAFVQKFISIVNQELKNPNLNIDFLSNKMGVSCSTLFRRIKQLSDMTPVEYIRDTRLKKAAELLLIDNVMIADVAFEVGFASPSYFSTCFTKQYGISPLEYLNRNHTIVNDK